MDAESAEARGKVLGVLAASGTLRDAADFAGVNARTLYRWRRESPQFAQAVLQAIAAGKLKHLGKLGRAPQWQASAWVLERRWPKEFAKGFAKGLKGARDAARHSSKTIRVRRVSNGLTSDPNAAAG